MGPPDNVATRPANFCLETDGSPVHCAECHEGILSAHCKDLLQESNFIGGEFR